MITSASLGNFSINSFQIKFNLSVYTVLIPKIKPLHNWALAGFFVLVEAEGSSCKTYCFEDLLYNSYTLLDLFHITSVCFMLYLRSKGGTVG